MAKYTTININVLNKAIQKTAKSRTNFMFNAARTKFVAAKQNMLREFDEHPVTQELKAGPEAEGNPSGTLGGRANLYAFIGFPAETEPTEIIRSALESFVNILNNPTITFGYRSATFSFSVVYPSLTEIYKATPSPFSSKSWVKGIEDGMWGLTHYLNGLYTNPPKDFSDWSRSGPAIESKSQVRADSFEARPYMKEILEHFVARVST